MKSIQNKTSESDNSTQWHSDQTHEGEFLQEQIQRLIRKALVTLESTLNDHNLPAADRLEASLKIVSLFQGNLDEPNPAETIPPSVQSPVIQNTTASISIPDSVPKKTKHLTENEITELEELRAVL